MQMSIVLISRRIQCFISFMLYSWVENEITENGECALRDFTGNKIYT